MNLLRKSSIQIFEKQRELERAHDALIKAIFDSCPKLEEFSFFLGEHSRRRENFSLCTINFKNPPFVREKNPDGPFSPESKSWLVEMDFTEQDIKMIKEGISLIQFHNILEHHSYVAKTYKRTDYFKENV